MTTEHKPHSGRRWEVHIVPIRSKLDPGWEPFAVYGNNVLVRRRKRIGVRMVVSRLVGRLGVPDKMRVRRDSSDNSESPANSVVQHFVTREDEDQVVRNALEREGWNRT